MPLQTKACQNCRGDFTIEPEDVNFYERLKVPQPTFCPECRLIRRLSFRNERSLYKRKCDLCGEAKIMMYPEGTKFPVYCRQCWWSDKWDAETYGRDFDPVRPFFEQVRDLVGVVPRLGVITQGNIVESEYINRVTDARHAYLVFGTNVSEYCKYSTWVNESRECVDCYSAQKCERCYECIDCLRCYNLRYSQECIECSDSSFLYNCRNCQDCFGCVNLRNRQYCIWNEQYSKEEYERILEGYQLGNALMLEGARAKFQAFRQQFIVPALVTSHSTAYSGNWIENSKFATRSFNCIDTEDVRYGLSLIEAKVCMDFSYWGAAAERIYEVVNTGRQCADVHFANECWDQVVRAEYVMNCHNSHDLFGCVGLRKKDHCILNKAYGEAEYQELLAQVKKQMDDLPYADARGRIYAYGEFFPADLSPHAYNESLAQEFFPLSKEEAGKRGYAWRDEEARTYSVSLPATAVPESIAGTGDDILQKIIGCVHAGRCNQKCTTAFRIIPDELAYYRKFNIPVPKLCPNCRHFERMAKRNPLKLWQGKCRCAGESSENGVYKNTAKTHPSHAQGEPCPNTFETSYAPDRPEIVYCIDCYTSEVS